MTDSFGYLHYEIVRDGRIISTRDNFVQAREYVLDFHDKHWTDCPKSCEGHYDEVYGTDNLVNPGNGLFQLKPKDETVRDKLGRITGKVRGWDYYHGRFFDE